MAQKSAHPTPGEIKTLTPIQHTPKTDTQTDADSCVFGMERHDVPLTSIAIFLHRNVLLLRSGVAGVISA
ncbi:hypothetical protein PHAMO_20084 [Magnetospirillum molischianum DSM 120]|uniref:Uncharacterized protein n=1 Tax=Magnetospirillum molischianum DSM 120 TaxID=1150626 RepID=H8FPW0_MAGML|nr:hypothetical protein PHAMO_20084 [Magnetospirillum molischianum DSM 120]